MGGSSQLQYIYYSTIKQTFVGVAKVKEKAPAASSANPRLHPPYLITVLTNRAGRFAILQARDPVIIKLF